MNAPSMISGSPENLPAGGAADLHVHSTASDGTMSPADIVRRAAGLGIKLLAITDHDTLDGLPEAESAANIHGIQLIRGLEISVSYRDRSFHVLGLGLQDLHPETREIILRIQEGRRKRNPMIIRKLNLMGYRISYHDVVSIAGGDIVGRPHIAQELVNRGYVTGLKQAFNRFLRPGKAAYVHRWRPDVMTAVRVIRKSGGIPVLAHPGLISVSSQSTLRHLILELKTQGIQGIETLYSMHTPVQVAFFERIADELGLVKTGGSDFHGDNKSDICLGKWNRNKWIPAAYMEPFLAALGLVKHRL